MCLKIITYVILVVFGQKTMGQSLRSKPNYPCGVYESTSIEGGQEFPNKSILFEGTMYPPDLYFSYKVDMESHEYKFNENQFKDSHKRGCICLIMNCVRKCCPPNKNYVQKTCVDTDLEFRRNVTDMDGNIVPNGFSHLAVVYGNTCPRGRRWMFTDMSYKLLQNGSLYIDYFTNEMYGHQNYCMENRLVSNDDYDDYEDVEDLNITSRVVRIGLLCFDDDDGAHEISPRFVLLSICMLFSIVFLTATFIIHVILPELRTLHGKCLMCCIAGLITAYSALSAIQMSVLNINDSTCFILGFLVYYAFMFTFFWLNATGFDIWWSFSGYRFCSSRTVETENIKFTFYSIYAWGGSLLLFAVTLGMHHHPNLHESHKPGIGINHCWLQDATVFRYFYGPILFLVLLNIFFFVASSIKIYNINRKLTMEEHQRFFLILKMFFIMGVTWIFEIVSWWLGGSKWLWIITDVFNALQGILIFMVYIFNPKVRQLLKKRFQDTLDKHPPARGVEFNKINSETLEGEVRTKDLMDNMSTY